MNQGLFFLTANSFLLSWLIIVAFRNLSLKFNLFEAQGNASGGRIWRGAFFSGNGLPGFLLPSPAYRGSKGILLPL